MSASQNWLADLGDAGRGGEAGMEAAEQRHAVEDYAGEDAYYAAETAHYRGQCNPRACDWYHTP